MTGPSGQHANRRASASAACSPASTHAYRDSVSHGEGSPVAVRNARPPPVTTSNESQEHATPVLDNTLDLAITHPTPSPLATPELLPQSDLHSQSPMSTSTEDMTDQQITYEVYNYILEMMEPNGADVSHYYETATRLPPITPESLQELDMSRIINNPKLRHDVNFDRELHFRPNLDGSKGRQKLKSADQYWLALEGELFMYAFAAQQKAQAADAAKEAYWKRVLQLSQRRLRLIFEAVRDILKTLVPDQEQKRVAARLDVDLIMQEIMNGVCDLIDLSNWLSKVLKAHCAPMRDELVDAMQQDIQQGALEGRNDKLVSGLRQLLNILEAMKLDVANHQIRHMRPLLVDDTVNFQRRYNAHRVAVGKIDVPKCQAWLQEELMALTIKSHGEQTPTHTEALTSALVRDVLFNEAQPYPQTFYLDGERLRFLRSDIRSTISHELCREVLAGLCPPWVAKPDLLKAQAALHCTVSAIVGMSGRFQDRIENIAVEIVRILLVLEGQYPPFDGSMLGIVEARLELALRTDGAVFDQRARSMVERILPKLKTSIDEHIRMSAVDLQDALVPPTPSSMPPPPPTLGFGAAMSAPTQAPKPYDPDEDVVRRFTHLICLHWHIWAELLYLVPTEQMISIDPLEPPASAPSPVSTDCASSIDSASMIGSTTTSPQHSPTMPVAKAVFEDGKKWLPIAIDMDDVPCDIPTPAASPAPRPNNEHSPVQYQQSPAEYQQAHQEYQQPPQPRRQSKADCSAEETHGEQKKQDGQEQQPA